MPSDQTLGMSYKAILVHVDISEGAGERINLAISIAKNQHACLVGAAVTGVTRFIYQAGLINGNDPNLTAHLVAQLETLRANARAALAEFEGAAKNAQVSPFETKLIDDDADGFVSTARINDLVVAGQPNPEDPSPAVAPDFPEFVVLHSGRPVLLVPYAGHFEQVGAKLMIAWDASVSATRAVSDALPILARAESVAVAVFNPESVEATDGPEAGADIAQYLARHGVKADVIRQKTDIDIGNALLSLAIDLNSDAIVMGAYGHSRMRERLLGGVTRTVLESMTIPVLMSH